MRKQCKMCLCCIGLGLRMQDLLSCDNKFVILFMLNLLLESLVVLVIQDKWGGFNCRRFEGIIMWSFKETLALLAEGF